MSRVHLVHWNAEEAAERAAFLERAGHSVSVSSADGALACRRIDDEQPDCVVVDLRRLPSHGVETARHLRERKATRHIPVVMVEGDPVKTTKARAKLEGLPFTPWARVRGAIRKAIASPPPPVRRNTPGPEGYSNTPLAKKLGIRAGSAVILQRAPRDFESLLGALPDRVTLRRRRIGCADLVVLFARTGADLERDLPGAMESLAEKAGLWIAWPKKTSALARDLTRERVREIGLAAGVVDVKICAIDADWSGMMFRRRRR